MPTPPRRPHALGPRALGPRALGLLALGMLALTGCGDSYSGPVPGSADAAPPLNLDPLGDDAFGALVALPRLDHVVFAGLIDRFLVREADQTLLDYDAWAASAEAGILFEQYLGLLARVDPTALADSAEKQAFYYNAYNALTIAGVLAGYGGDPSWSVSDDGFQFFKDIVFVVGGELLSLDALENGVMRGAADHASVLALPAETRDQVLAWHADLWDAGPLDPRLHVAINCASLGCPDLLTAFRGPTLEVQLAEASARFLANPRKGAGPDGVSMLFTWFAPDFAVGSYDGPASFIARWRAGGTEGVDLGGDLDYSWQLNLGAVPTGD